MKRPIKKNVIKKKILKEIIINKIIINELEFNNNKIIRENNGMIDASLCSFHSAFSFIFSALK